MRFDIRFIFQIKSVFITQVVPVRIVRIMGVTDMIDIGTFHQHHFVFHHLAGDGMANSRITFMTVDTLQFNGLAIDVIVASGQSEFVIRSGRIFDFHFAETDSGRDCFHCAAFLSFNSPTNV